MKPNLPQISCIANAFIIAIMSGCNAPGHHHSRAGSAQITVVGEGHLKLTQPVAIALHPLGGILLTDSGNNRILWLNHQGHINAQWGTQGNGPGQFMRPLGIATDSRHRIYVADYMNDRIQILNTNGATTFTWKTFATNIQLNGPADITIDKNDRIYVVEFNGSRVIQLDLNGHLIRTFSDPGQLYYPTRITTDPTGKIWVTDAYNHRLVIYDANGNLIRTVGSNGSDAGEFEVPGKVDFDQDARPWVVDFYNHRLQRFPDATGHSPADPITLNTNGSTVGPLKYPTDVLIDKKSSAMFLVDYGNDRLLKFKPIPDDIYRTPQP